MATNIRALSAKCIYAVIDQGRSLNDELPKQQEKAEGKDKALMQEICYGVMRYLPELENDVRGLMKKPLTGKQRVFHFLILVGVYQIKYTRIPDHAALSETVEATTQLKNKHLKGLINGVLRNFQREYLKTQDSPKNVELPDPIKFNHPGWFIKKVQSAYPEQWQDILFANQERPPMWIRVNQQHHSVEAYKELLAQAEIDIQYTDDLSGAIALTQAVDVNKLPGFSDGWVSIQDGAAQQAARLLDAQSGDIVLDCCAAPGGKTCHIIEHTDNLGSVTAVDIEEKRLVRVEENLARLNLDALVIVGDAAQPDTWWDKTPFDRILLDVPCSATGVIRRHPDIKWLRKAQDIEKLVELQEEILKSIWSLLKPGGTMLYATCSILPEENAEQINKFISSHSDAELIPLNENTKKIGWQLLPHSNLQNQPSMDGFYYAKLKKLK